MTESVPAVAPVATPSQAPPKRGDDPPSDAFAVALGSAAATESPPPGAPATKARTAAAEGKQAEGDSSGQTDKSAAPAGPPVAAVETASPLPALAAAAELQAPPALPSAAATGSSPAKTARPAAASPAKQPAAAAPAASIQNALPAAAATAAPVQPAAQSAPAVQAPTPAPAGAPPVTAAPAPNAGTLAAATLPAPAAASAEKARPAAAKPNAAAARPATVTAPPAGTARPAAPVPGGHGGAGSQQSFGQPAPRQAQPQPAPSAPAPAAQHEAAASPAAPVADPAATAAPAAPVAATPAVPQDAKAASTLTANATMQDIADVTGTTMRMAVRAGQPVARITLQPEELGGVQVTMRYHDNGVSATVTTDNRAAAQELLQSGADLRRSLESQGVTVHGLDVQLSGDDRGSNQNGERAADTARAMGPAGGGDAEADEAEITIQPSRLPLPGSQIDVFA